VYLIALGVVHALAPRLQPVQLQSVSGSAGVGEPL
jgi:hypothetical protein